MTRPKRAERARAISDEYRITEALQVLVDGVGSVASQMLDFQVENEDVLRGARKCRDNAARYRAERDEARRDLEIVRVLVDAAEGRERSALARAERAESYIATEDMG